MSLTDPPAIYNAFEDEETLKSLSELEVQQFKAEKRTLIFKKGQTIIKEGSNPDGIFFIIKGTAKLYKNGFNGKEQILRFAKEGDIIGYRSILCNEEFGASAKAMEDMQICYIPEYLFLRILEVNSKLSFDMLKRISSELGEASKTITILAQKTVRERLAEVFLLLEKKLGTDSQGYIQISLTREEMANLIGTATESVIRLISEFKNDNLLEVNGRKLKILDHQKLIKLAHVSA